MTPPSLFSFLPFSPLTLLLFLLSISCLLFLFAFVHLKSSTSVVIWTSVQFYKRPNSPPTPTRGRSELLVQFSTFSTFLLDLSSVSIWLFNRTHTLFLLQLLQFLQLQLFFFFFKSISFLILILKISTFFFFFHFVLFSRHHLSFSDIFTLKVP